MTCLAIFGAVLVAAGLFGLVFCITQALAIRRDPGSEDARKRLARLGAMNLASVGIAALGLGLILAGLLLG